MANIIVMIKPHTVIWFLSSINIFRDSAIPHFFKTKFYFNSVDNKILELEMNWNFRVWTL